ARNGAESDRARRVREWGLRAQGRSPSPGASRRASCFSGVGESSRVPPCRTSGHWMAVVGGITPAAMKGELTLDVREHAAGAEAEELRLQPAPSQLLLHQHEPVERLLRGANPTRWLESHGHARALEILADRARHDQSYRQCRIDAFLAGGGLDEIATGHHRNPARARHVTQGRKIACTEDDLAMRFPAGLLESGHFIIQSLPLAAEHVRACDDHIDLVCSRIDRAAYFRETLLEWIQTGRKASGHSGDANIGSLQSAPRSLHEQVINAHCRYLERQVANAERLP